MPVSIFSCGYLPERGLRRGGKDSCVQARGKLATKRQVRSADATDLVLGALSLFQCSHGV